MQTLVDLYVMNTYKRAPIQIEKGKGTLVWDREGKQYLDFTSGIATCNLGHVPDTVKKALSKQLEELWHCSNLYENGPQEKLAERLVSNSCFNQVFFCNSGAEANEAAIKLARLYANKNMRSPEIISFKQSFHGRTLATLSASGQEKIQVGFTPLMQGFFYLPYNDILSLEQLEKLKPCAVILEIVQGEGGVHPADQQWLSQLVSICQKEQILIIADEVQTGMGRTGSLFAYEQYGFEPDIATLAKGLGSGFPIGAMLAKKEIAEYFQPGTHGSTFGGNPLAATAGLATIEHLTANKFLANSQKVMNFLWKNLQLLKNQFEFIKEIRGLGFLIGVEIAGEVSSIIDLARSKGLLLLNAGPNVIRILPPLTVTKEEIKEFLVLFNQVLTEYEEEHQ